MRMSDFVVRDSISAALAAVSKESSIRELVENLRLIAQRGVRARGFECCSNVEAWFGGRRGCGLRACCETDATAHRRQQR